MSSLRNILLSSLGAFVACADAEPLPTRPLEPPQEFRSVDDVYAPEEAQRIAQREARRVVPAFVDDPDYSSGPEVVSRRVVYRVTLRVPRNLGVGHAAIPALNSELVFDVSDDRLRARFVGAGWPVANGAEVRIRRDQPGAYVFDGRGGRPLAPGQLAQWFEGGRLRREPSLRISPPNEEQADVPGPLICRFIAEWSRTVPESIERRCGHGGTPPSFRVGLWRAIRTADVPLHLPRRDLRADDGAPPEPLREESARLLLTRGQIERLRRVRGVRLEGEPDSPSEGLIVENTSRARMIVTIGGTPSAWIDVGESLHFLGLQPGVYAVGAMRPLGLQTAQKRVRAVPNRIRLPR